MSSLHLCAMQMNIYRFHMVLNEMCLPWISHARMISVVGFDNTFRQIWYRRPRIPGGNISLALDQTIAATTVKRMAYVLQISFYCRIHVCDSSVSHPRCGKDDEQHCYIYYAMAKSLQRQKAASEVTSVVSHSCLTREEKKSKSHIWWGHPSTTNEIR